ncbi:ubiquitin carboxyl-terminal hydrolase 17-like protein 6 [Megaptera novaeangliae]
MTLVPRKGKSSSEEYRAVVGRLSRPSRRRRLVLRLSQKDTLQALFQQNAYLVIMTRERVARDSGHSGKQNSGGIVVLLEHQMENLVDLVCRDVEAASLDWGDECPLQFDIFPKLHSPQPSATGVDAHWGSPRPEEPSPPSQMVWCSQRGDLTPVSAGLACAQKLLLPWRLPFVVGAGLQNVGNTCYMNAALQCLTHTPPLASSMLSQQHSTICPNQTFCMLCAMQTHITRALLHPGEVIRSRKDLVASFHRHKQEDAHEFLMFTLDAMQQACLSAPELLGHPSEDTTLVHRIFGGSWRCQIQCLHCLGVSDTLDPYLDITLDITAAQSVVQALKELVKPEKLDGENAYHCSVCLKKVPATKRLTLHSASQVLIVVLKRFTEVTGVKMVQKVHYPECLDLRPYVSEQKAGPLDYALSAVLVHAGWSGHQGHYFCYVKAGNGQWYKVDNAMVTACDVTSALRQSAYVLFYVQNSALEGDSGGVSPGGARTPLGAEPTCTMAAHREPERDVSIGVPGSEEPLEGTDVQEVSLEQWRNLQAPNRPKPVFNLRKIESALPADAVVIHPSNYEGGMSTKLCEQENYQFNHASGDTAPQRPINIGSNIPCLSRRARASKKKNKKKQRSVGALQKAQSVVQALNELVKPKKLDGKNAYHCSVCLKKVPATKMLVGGALVA